MGDRLKNELASAWLFANKVAGSVMNEFDRAKLYMPLVVADFRMWWEPFIIGISVLDCGLKILFRDIDLNV